MAFLLAVWLLAVGCRFAGLAVAVHFRAMSRACRLLPAAHRVDHKTLFFAVRAANFVEAQSQKCWEWWEGSCLCFRKNSLLLEYQAQVAFPKSFRLCVCCSSTGLQTHRR